MSNLKHYPSPFHVTHEDEIADKMAEEVDIEINEEIRIGLLMNCPEDEVALRLDNIDSATYFDNLLLSDKEGDSHKQLDLLSPSTEEEVIYGIDWLSQLEGKDEQGDSHKQLDLFE